MSAIAKAQPRVHYADSDGQPMADNTVQFEWIAIIKWNLEYQFANDPEVFIAGDHLIYPVEGNAKLRQAPDVYAAFGRPKGDRGSYRVWEEGGIFPQVVFEVWSPGNRYEQMEDKKDFYERYGVEEYYIVYPDDPAGVAGWTRVGDEFVLIPDMHGYISPRLRVRFAMDQGNLALFGPDGRRFVNPARSIAERDLAERRATTERQRSEKLAAKLRELGVDPESL